MADAKTVRTAPKRPGSSGDGHRTTAPGGLIRIIGIVGRVLVALGLVMLFFVAYLLWGTNVYTRQAQNELARTLEQKPIVTDEQVAAGDIPPARPATPPNLGDGLFTIKIPKLALEHVVVEGVEREELKKGPGHFPDCATVPAGTDCIDGSPFPGEDGNVALSGHRTTYGAPFFRLNELEPGDVIDIESGPARYRYTVREQKIVDPNAREVVANRGVPELTLTTCHPRFSAAQRLIIHADFEGASLTSPPPAAAEPAEGAEQPEEQAEGEAELVPAGDPIVPVDVLALAAIAIVALLGAMALSDRLRRAAAWSGVSVVAAIGLWVVVFPQVLQMIPANY